MTEDEFKRTSGTRRGERPDTAPYRVTIENRLRRALPLLVFGAFGILAGGLVAAAVAHAPTSALVWLAAYLVLVVGVAQFALAVGQALLSEPVVGKGRIGLEWALFNLGSVGVAGGTLDDSFLFVALGTAMVLGALVAFMLTVGRARTGYAIRLYQGLIGIVATGAVVGLLLSSLGTSP